MDDLAQLMNASASHQEVTENGPPAQPLQFPPPTVGRAHRVTAIVHNPATSEEAQVPNVVYEARSDGAAPVRGYWIGRKLKKAIYGCVRSCTVLRLRPGSTWTGPESGAAGGGAAWEVTPEMAAVKIMDWNLVRDLRGRHMEDPVKEVSAMQYLCTDGGSPNVLGTLDVMSDEQYLYSFMPFCSCGELFGYVERDGRFSEPVACTGSVDAFSVPRHEELVGRYRLFGGQDTYAQGCADGATDVLFCCGIAGSANGKEWRPVFRGVPGVGDFPGRFSDTAAVHVHCLSPGAFDSSNEHLSGDCRTSLDGSGFWVHFCLWSHPGDWL